MINNFPCELYSGKVGDNHDSVQCDLFNKWNDTGCLNIGVEKSEKPKKRSTILVLSQLCNGNTFLDIS